MNNFTTDDNWQREVRNNILAPYYKSVSHESRFVFLDKGKLADKLQREFAIDTIIQGKNNAVFGIGKNCQVAWIHLFCLYA